MTESEAIAKFQRTSVLWESASNTEMVEAVKVAISALEEIQQYREIGTVSEFRELKEKATPKKVEVVDEGGIVFYICPTCGKANANSRLKTEPRYCKGCGQKLDWSEGKE